MKLLTEEIIERAPRNDDYDYDEEYEEDYDYEEEYDYDYEDYEEDYEEEEDEEEKPKKKLKKGSDKESEKGSSDEQKDDKIDDDDEDNDDDDDDDGDDDDEKQSEEAKKEPGKKIQYQFFIAHIEHRLNCPDRSALSSGHLRAYFYAMSARITWSERVFERTNVIIVAWSLFWSEFTSAWDGLIRVFFSVWNAHFDAQVISNARKSNQR